MHSFNDVNNQKVKNKLLQSYLDIYKDVEHATIEQIQGYGLPFERENNQKQIYLDVVQQLQTSGALIRNNGKSVVSNGRLSSACEACQTGTGSYTSFVSLKCHKQCYFCFNENQDNYQFYLNNKRNASQELKDLAKQGEKLTHIALTGGEPLLHPQETIAFFQEAERLYPGSHTRLYTTGDFLTKEILEQLKQAALNEIRFSIKLEDSMQRKQHTLRQIELAKTYINTIIVEMPIMPNALEPMKALLLELEARDVFGINLLELCFPFRNVEDFKEKGFTLKNPPYDVYYNFWYAGGLAIADSEKISLELVRFALENDLKLGVHYCSLENKFTGQIYQQNFDAKLDSTYKFSSTDYYWKTAKVFGADWQKVAPILKKRGFSAVENSTYQFRQFSTDALRYLEDIDVEILLSYNVVEYDGEGANIREVHVEVL